jgi:hypothetical protein
MARKLGPPQPADPEMLRQLQERHDFFSKRENLERYPDKIVAVYQGRVWGCGDDHMEAIRSAAAELERCAGQPGTPTPRQLVYLVIPDVVTPEPPLPDY